MSAGPRFRGDPYQVLGVAPEATPEALRTAYTRLARLHHPEANPDDPQAARRFQQIHQAYQVLSNPELRAAFDRQRLQRDELVERALSAANMHRRKGEFEQAWRVLDEALVAAPNDAAVLELMGQVSLDEGDPAQAQRSFERALELEPGRPTAEVGLGNALLELQATEPEPMSLQPAASDGIIARKQPQTALVLSLCIPGLGQMYALEFARGLILFALSLPLWGLSFNAFMSYLGGTLSRGGGEGGNALLWLVGLLLLALHAFAAWDAERVTRALKEEAG